MDILHLVDRLEELFNQSRAIPLTHNVVIDEDRFLDLIDQMRVAIPEEMKKAQQVLAQKDRILAQAQEEADRTLAIAREKSDLLMERDAIVQSAQSRSDALIEQARLEYDKIRREADEYVVESLSRLEIELDRSLTQVRNGIRSLQSEKFITEKPPTE